MYHAINLLLNIHFNTLLQSFICIKNYELKYRKHVKIYTQQLLRNISNEK